MASSHNLVFLHGWGTDPGVWKNQVEYFSAKYRIEAPALYPSLRVTRPSILIGWSYGGMLAMEMAAKEPRRVKALILVSSSAKFTDGLNPVIIKNIRRNLERNFEDEMRNCYGTFFITGEARFMNDFIESQILPEKKGAIRALERLLAMDLRSLLRGITAPTLIIHGDRDEVCPAAGGVYLHENIKGSRIEIMKNAGHMPFYTRAGEFNRILEGFLAGLG
ncbi:MAG: alpha/beta fold hydrolase [Candidatus Omnitrophica bacterium]|nr:alpha/beta fold hydrolase [Candidatus Omnitrophota bacterium]